MVLIIADGELLILTKREHHLHPRVILTAVCRAWLAIVTFLFFVLIMATINHIQHNSVKRMLIGILIGMLIGMFTEYRHSLMMHLK